MNYNEMNVNELKQQAKKLGLKNYSKLKKIELINALINIEGIKTKEKVKQPISDIKSKSQSKQDMIDALEYQHFVRIQMLTNSIENISNESLKEKFRKEIEKENESHKRMLKIIKAEESIWK